MTPLIPPRASRKVIISTGGRQIAVGGGAPVMVQSMTNTDTADVIATAIQVKDLARAGSEIVRITVNTPEAAAAVPAIREQLERIGVGRPSTFAATIGTIERRGYVFRQGKALVPSYTAFAVTRLLREHFGDLIDVEFTAEMEEDLDQISRGEREWLDFIKQFYRGDKNHRGLEDAVKQANEEAEYPLIDIGVDAETNEPIRVRIGRYGPFIQVGEGGPGKTSSLPPKHA